MSEILYKSTRSDSAPIPASRAIVNGLAPDGGLYVPTEMPKLPVPPKDLCGRPYREVAFAVMRQFLGDFTDEELQTCIDRAYDEKFDTPEIAPLAEHGGLYYLELFHGATIAFKDMALSILPHLMTTAAKKNGIREEIVILTATSGDTGKAALAGFADVPGTRIIVFYPKDGVSAIQERQMVTQKGENTFVAGIRGNFDDAQTGVKKLFGDEALKEELLAAGYRFSSANSINIGRLVPQVAYYVWLYVKLLERGAVSDGEPIDVTVPTGNFGNILAAYYAREMGIPIRRLLCASNENKVLYDFFSTGTYDRNRDFYLTSSPSMDILISSNLERLIYEICGRDSAQNRAFMEALSVQGRYTLPEEMKAKLSMFEGGYTDEAGTRAEIARVFEQSGYVVDPHTAVASAVAQRYAGGKDDAVPVAVVSTASPFKFPASVLGAVAPDRVCADEFEMADALADAGGIQIPAAVLQLKNAEIRHRTVCAVNEMKQTVKDYLKM